MKQKKVQYLSYRITCMFIALAAFLLFILISITRWAVEDQEYMFLVAGSYLALGILLILAYRWIYQPYKESVKIAKLFNTGYTLQGIFEQRVWLSPESEKSIGKFKEMIHTNELINATKKQAEYLALQNQINPHFLYNTLEGIRGETLNAGLDSVAKMTEALATFFRYTISNVENLVTLEDELSNIENYYIIQQYRFGEHLNLSIEYDEDEEFNLFQYKLPKLILQPIVENSIYHGLERKVGKGNLRIKLENTVHRLIITISDDGLGMSEERLNQLNNKINHPSFHYIQPDSEARGGIAMINVNNRIKLLFGEEYGICIYSTQNVGTDVVITLPLMKKDYKEIR